MSFIVEDDYMKLIIVITFKNLVPKIDDYSEFTLWTLFQGFILLTYLFEIRDFL